MTAPRVVDPIVVATRVAASGAELDIVVPDDLSYFEGHFPGAPVVPGVVQIKWAIELARGVLGIPTGFAGVEALKFQRPLMPGARATLALEYTPTDRKLRFSFVSSRARYSSGSVLLGTAP